MTEVMLGVHITDDFYDAICNTIIAKHNKQMIDKPAKIRGCRHKRPTETKRNSEKNKYCAECGKPIWIANPEVEQLTRERMDECGGIFGGFIDDDPSFSAFQISYNGGYMMIGTEREKLDEHQTISQLKIQIAENLSRAFNYRITKNDVDLVSIEDSYR